MTSINSVIDFALILNEVDIGITWKEGLFWPSGAKLLDEELVNKNLKWLSDSDYITVVEPFTKGLQHFLEAQSHPERLSDVVTDIYESLEAMTRIVVGNDKDLSGNKERFIKKLNLNKHHSTMLSAYIDYGCEYRHAAKKSTKKSPLNRNEVESFIYLTGLFIRIAIQQIEQTK